jgi:ATP-dependent RNA helicase DeaD
MLRIIERATRHKIEEMNLPSIADVNEQRVARFKQRIADTLAAGEGEVFRPMIEQLERDQNVSAIQIAAALASLVQGGTPLLLPEKPERQDAAGSPKVAHEARGDGARGDRGRGDSGRGDSARGDSARGERGRRGERRSGDKSEPHAPRRQAGSEKIAFESFRVEVGHVHGVKPGNIVGAIANEAGLEGRHIGHVDIREDHSFVDLPEGMPKEIFRELKKVRVVGRELQITRVASKPPRPSGSE